MHYQDIVDEIFGSSYRHRTLRTIFDCYSTEWDETRVEKKNHILNAILESKKITFPDLISGYKNFFMEELAGKEHVISSLKSSLKLLKRDDRLKVIDGLTKEEIGFEHAYKYQEDLTLKLDKIDADFTQEIINEIVLWKVNRYAKIKQHTFDKLNQIKKTDKEINKELTKEILSELLKTSGVRLAMASTILRFKNPYIYQIIDQRAYRFLYGNIVDYDTKEHEEQIRIYLDYLERLKQDCIKFNILFEEADRKLYSLDKQHNKNVKLKNFGS